MCFDTCSLCSLCGCVLTLACSESSMPSFTLTSLRSSIPFFSLCLRSHTRTLCYKQNSCELVMPLPTPSFYLHRPSSSPPPHTHTCMIWIHTIVESCAGGVESSARAVESCAGGVARSPPRRRCCQQPASTCPGSHCSPRIPLAIHTHSLSHYTHAHTHTHTTQLFS